MSDFIVRVGRCGDPERIIRSLRERPGLEQRSVRRFEFPWGDAIVQEPSDNGYRAFRSPDAAVFAAGRPRFIGVAHESQGEAGFNELLFETLNTETVERVGSRLTGMFVCCVCTPEGVRLFTDRMFRPAYLYEAGDGMLAIGTQVESLAIAAGCDFDWDTVSLAELLVRSHITFPFTTRRHIREVQPAAVLTVSAAERGFAWHANEYWVPAEPEIYPSESVLARNLEDAMRFAGEDISRGSARVAVTLSGGKDSRAVIGSLPKDRLKGAVTYCTRENRETEIAGRVASAVGIRHLLAVRDPEFYAHLIDRATRLLGTELKATAHGYALVDANLQHEYDLFVGGQFSDTLLKDYFMPQAQIEAIVGVPMRERVRRAAARVLGRTAGSRDDRLMDTLTPPVREAMHQRRTARLEAVRRVRQRSADEWVQFWPTSRHHVSSHTLGNSRLYPFESLFMHTAILDVAVTIPPHLKAGGRLCNQVFGKLYGPMGAIENANTGLPPTATPAAEARALHRLKHDAARWRAFSTLPASEHPWNDVQSSWANAKALQLYSPVWQDYRQALQHSPALDVIGPLLTRNPRGLLAEYQSDLGPNFNQMAIQLAYHLDRVIRAK